MERLKFLDGFRGIAVVLVVLFHLNLIPFGFAGVEIFFVISGYIITVLLLREYEKNGRIDMKNFYIRRISRIYPILMIVLISILLISINFPIISIQEKVSNEILYGSFNIANWYDYFHSNSYWESGVQTPTLHLWSLGIEMQFYFIWPFFMKYLLQCKKNKSQVFNWLIVVYILLLSVTIYMTWGGIKGIFYYNTFLRVGSFIVGGYFAYLSMEKTMGNQSKKNWVVTVWSFLFFIFLTSQFSLKSPNLYRLVIPLYTLNIGYLFYMFYQKKAASFLNKIIENRVLVFFGDISYSLYMVHVPIIIYLNTSKFSQFRLVQTYDWLLNVIGVTISIIVAFLLYIVVEKKIKIKTGKAALIMVFMLPLSVYWIQQKIYVFKVVHTQEAIEEQWIAPEPIISKEGTVPILVVGDSWSRRTGFGMTKAQKKAPRYQILTYGMGNASIMNPDYFFNAEKKPVYQAKTFSGYEKVWSEAIEQYEPKYVVLQFGNADQSNQQIDGKEMRVGDAKFDQRFILQYQKIIDFYKKNKIDIIVLNVVHNDQGSYNRMNNKLSDAMNRNINEVVRRNPEINFIDVQSLLEDTDKLITRQIINGEDLFDETNHPSYAGSIYIGEQVLDKISKIEGGF